MFGQSLLSGAFGSSILDPGLNFNTKLYTGNGSDLSIGGKINGDATFNGSTSNINFGSGGIQATSAVDVSFSISWWMKTTATDASSLFNTYGTGSGSYGFTVEFGNPTAGKFRLWTNYGGSANTGESTNAYNDGSWHHVALVKNAGATLKLYVDTLEILSANINSGSQVGNPLVFGYYTDHTQYEYTGQLDQTRMFNTALTTTQIASLYAEDASTASTLDFPVGAGCQAGYTFDANANTIGPVPNSTTGVTTCDFPTGAGGQLLYQFEDNSNDTCNTYNATAGGNITYASGLFSKAAKLTASTNSAADAITVPDSVASLVVNNFTVSFWMNADYLTDTGSLNEVNPFAFQKGRRYFVSFLSSGVLQTYNGSSMLQSSAGVINQTGFWYNIVMSQSSTTGRALYVNSVLVASDNATSDNASYNPGGSENVIGGYKSSSAWGLMFRGLIDQFRIFNTVLTQTQVNQLARGAYNGISTDVAYLGFLNFQPDLTWIKSRTYGYPNILGDSVRGLGNDKMLISDFTGGEGSTDANYANAQAYGYISSLDTNGFSTKAGTTNSSYVSNAGNYVSWNWKAGADTYAGLFNGSSSLIAVGSPIPNTDTDVSISAWVKLDSGVSSNMHITGTGITSAGSEAPFRATLSYVSANTFKIFALRQVAGTYYLAGTGGLNNVTINASTWYHVVWSYNSTGRKLSTFLNGTAIDTDVAMTTSGSSVNDSSTVIGSFRSTSGPFFDGSIDQVRMFNTVLTQTQITALYNETSEDNTTLNFPAGAGCTAAYTLNKTANDVSGNYNGTASNVTYAKSGYTGRNNGGSIESQVSANQDAGFSIIKYRGVQPGSGNVSTIGHGLKNPPELIITKVVNSSNGWPTLYYKGSDKFCVRLNTTAGSDANNLSLMFGNGTNAVAPTSSVYTVGNSDETNYAYDYIAYAWHSVDKYSKIGTYVGNGNTTGPTVNTGFEPAWILFKRTDATNGWSIIDSARSTSNPRTSVLQPMNADQEYTSSSYAVDFLSDGFQIKNSDNGWNTSGGTYIYMAFAVPLTT